jgi:hypothetical protein
MLGYLDHQAIIMALEDAKMSKQFTTGMREDVIHNSSGT